MITLNEKQTADGLPFERLIPALREMFRTGCHVPPRHIHQVEAQDARGTVLIMPAWNDRYLGIKTVNVYPGNAARGLPGLFSVYTLFDAATGQPLAQLDGDVITSRRTAAASALAATYLASRTTAHLLVVGTGRVASLLPQAYGAVFPLTRVEVWGRNPDAAGRLAAGLAAQGLPAHAVVDALDNAIARAPIVSVATLATEPVVRGALLQPGSHLDLIGSFTPQMREADDDAFRHAAVYVDTEEALAKSGDLLGPLARGVFQREEVGTLADLCRDARPGRTHAAQRTVFKSAGTALEDLTAAILVYESQ